MLSHETFGPSWTPQRKFFWFFSGQARVKGYWMCSSHLLNSSLGPSINIDVFLLKLTSVYSTITPTWTMLMRNLLDYAMVFLYTYQGLEPKVWLCVNIRLPDPCSSSPRCSSYHRLLILVYSSKRSSLCDSFGLPWPPFLDLCLVSLLFFHVLLPALPPLRKV